MSLALTIVMLISGWLAVATAMLWGVLRITRRHHHLPVPPAAPAKADKADKADKAAMRHATAH
ncbi:MULTISPECIES: hypothetical protein [unclassified Pseudomonas]|uniref:hypothetical protein n=1 Tax=unclassified Pseudomonas TaxID=196821 RepID=UPI002115817B|nr:MULTISPECIES: hypothetical protein [unclassified Pseudomonas]